MNATVITQTHETVGRYVRKLQNNASVITQTHEMVTIETHVHVSTGMEIRRSTANYHRADVTRRRYTQHTDRRGTINRTISTGTCQ